VPCLIRWPGKLSPGKNAQWAAHIDLAPTLLAACRVERPATVKFDGVNLLDVLLGGAPQTDRQLFFQWHRGDRPELFRACAVRQGQFKLVQAVGRDGPPDFVPQWQLFDMLADPDEEHSLMDERRELAATMKNAYENWFADVGSTRGYPPPRIIAGTKHENPLTLTRQDWRGPKADWGAKGQGYWELELAAAGAYDVGLRMPASSVARKARLRIGTLDRELPWPAGAEQVIFKALHLDAGAARLETGVTEHAGDEPIGVHYVDLSCHAPQEGP
jgi:hypothetical protein